MNNILKGEIEEPFPFIREKVIDRKNQETKGNNLKIFSNE